MNNQLKLSSTSEFNNLLQLNNKKTIVSFVNPFSYFSYIKNGYDENFDFTFSDGSLLTALNNLFFNKVDRISFDFSSVADNVFRFCLDNDLPIAIVGGMESEIALAIDNLSKLYNGINICFYRAGYFNDESEIADCIDCINNSRAKLIICGMGHPHQEKFLIKCKDKINYPFLAFTCGGFITQTSINQDYYHPIIKKYGLRWLQRAYMHSHVRHRLFVDYPKFIIRYLFCIVLKSGKI